MQLSLFPSEPRLSKSKYISGLQCHKRLYLEIYCPELATQTDEETQAVLDSGSHIGELARHLFPGGVLVDWDGGNLTLALRRTEDLLRNPGISAIFEATFKFDNVLIRVDVLERVAPHEWRLIEVKASTRLKAVHLDDIALQAYVLQGCGVALESMRLMYLNRQYQYQGGVLDLKSFFVQLDLSAEVATRLPGIPAHLASMKAMLIQNTPPQVAPSDHCHAPYGCPFWEHCTETKPARWIFYLPGPRRIVNKLLAQGIETIDAIPADTKLSDTQQRMKQNTEWIGSGLKDALQTVRYPVHHLDFEGFMPAVPLFPGTRPYQTLPFQWSLHIEHEDGSLRHEQYLSVDADRDPRPQLADALLCALGRDGSICVYSGYEWRILMDLAEALPLRKRELSLAATRLWDLFPVVRRYYYHPHFDGSYSIKSVLPALSPTLNYGGLAIADGATAALRYYRMVSGQVQPEQKELIRNSLIEYCMRDTLALVHIRKVLYEKALAAEQNPAACVESD